MSTSARLSGRTAIVTGAGRGIGLAIAAALSDNGAAVVLVDRDPALLDAALSHLGDGRQLRAITADVSAARDMERVAEATKAAFGSIDILCPNAAVFDAATIDELEETAWDRLMSVNLKGVFLTMRACIPTMKAQRYGRIVATSSITGNRTAIVGMSHYGATKAGINGFVRTAALELAPFGIAVNAIEPGHVITEGAAPLYDDEFKAAVENFIPAGRFATPEDIGAVAVFFASEAAGYITGQTLVVDGGLTLREYPPGYPRSN